METQALDRDSELAKRKRCLFSKTEKSLRYVCLTGLVVCLCLYFPFIRISLI